MLKETKSNRFKSGRRQKKVNQLLTRTLDWLAVYFQR